MPKKQRKITMQSALDLFLLDCTARRLTKGTHQFYRAKVSPFVRFLEKEGITHLQDIEAVHIRKYLASVLERGLSAGYQNDIARAIRAWLNFCTRDELIKQSPFDKVQMPKMPKHLQPAFSDADIKNILRVCDSRRDESICLFLIDSGVRASELVALNVGDVNTQTGAVTVNGGKGQKDRVTYIGARTRKVLVRYLAERNGIDADQPLFLARGSIRLTLSGIVQIMRRIRKASGVAHCTAHTFRRTMAINCVRNGMNIHILARLLGHADIQMLRKYLDITQADLKSAHDKSGVVDNMF